MQCTINISCLKRLKLFAVCEDVFGCVFESMFTHMFCSVAETVLELAKLKCVKVGGIL